MWLGEPPQPAVKLPAGEQITIKNLKCEGMHSLGRRFSGTVTFNQIEYVIEFNEASVQFPFGKPDQYFLITNLSGVKYWSLLGTKSNTIGFNREALAKHGEIYTNANGGWFPKSAIKTIHAVAFGDSFPQENEVGQPYPV